jgi:hypothetical protein
MRYYKRLKNEFLSLSEKVGEAAFNAEPTKKGIRARALDSLVRVMKSVLAIDEATMFDGPLEPGEPKKWATYLARLEGWVQDMPVPGSPEVGNEQERVFMRNLCTHLSARFGKDLDTMQIGIMLHKRCEQLGILEMASSHGQEYLTKTPREVIQDSSRAMNGS